MMFDKIISRIEKHIDPNRWKLENCMEEITLSFGKEAPDKTYFIIRRDYSNIGLFSIFITTLGWIKYAIQKGYIPIVDMQNYPNVYLEENEVGSINAWEKFFYQPMNYTLADIRNKKNVIYSSMSIPLDRPNDTMEFFNNVDGQLDEWRGLCKRFIRVKDDIIRKVDEEWNEMFGSNEGVLGVFLRGTDYVKCRFPNHPVQPNSTKVISDVKQLVPKCYKKIFLCTEDTKIIDEFRREFGSAVYVNRREFVSYKEGITVNSRIERENDAYIQGEEYLRQILTLSRCRNIVVSRTSGTVGMALFSDAWEYCHIYDLGRYPE